MKQFRVTSSLLICASMLALAACGGEDKDATASAGPAVSSAAVVPSAAPASTAAADPAASISDKELCTSANKAGENMKTAFVAAFQAVGSGELPPPAELAKILTDMKDELTELSAAGAADSKVAAAVEKFSAEAAEAASAADPATAADNPEFEKAGADITAACKAAGVKVNF